MQKNNTLQDKSSKIMCNNKLIARINQIDFIDLGGGGGGSYKYIKQKFHYKNGLVIDIDEDKVNEALKNGVPAIVLDVTDLSVFNDNACKLVSIVDTLEHLPDLTIIEKVIKESIRVASDTVLIRGPMFYDEYLKERRLRFYWAHWTGHTCHVEPDHIIKILEKYKITNFEVKNIDPVISSSNSSIHPIDGKKDRHSYRRWIDPPKPRKIELENIYEKFEILIKLN